MEYNDIKIYIVEIIGICFIDYNKWNERTGTAFHN